MLPGVNCAYVQQHEINNPKNKYLLIRNQFSFCGYGNEKAFTGKIGCGKLNHPGKQMVKNTGGERHCGKLTENKSLKLYRSAKLSVSQPYSVACGNITVTDIK